MMKLGLGIICKDESEQIARILSKYAKYFGEIQITVTDPSQHNQIRNICNQFGANVSYFDWGKEEGLLVHEGVKLFPFDRARNFNKAQFKESDYYLTMDCDDELSNPENLKSLHELARTDNIAVVYGYYIYSRDEYGAINASHNKERIIKLTDNLFWNKPIHENVIPKVQKNHFIYLSKPEELEVVHVTTKEHADASAKRNLKYLIAEWEKDKDDTDPRTLAYLGRTLAALQDYKAAKYFLTEHISRSGWDEDRYMSWCQLSHVYMALEDEQNAISSALKAMTEKPSYPDAYLQLHDVYLNLMDYASAEHWGKIGLSLQLPQDTFILVDPSKYTWRPALSMAWCYLSLGKVENAYKFYELVKKYVPDYKKLLGSNLKLFEKSKERKDFVEHVLGAVHYLRDNSPELIDILLGSIPKDFQDTDLMLRLRNTYAKPKKYGANSIVFFCGPSVAAPNWSPKSIETGIGGSEEAVIYLSKELAKLGWEVTVFNDCQEAEGTYDGVKYINYNKFNPNDEYNLLISWRLNISSRKIKAQKVWVWLHDVPNEETVGSVEDIKLVDKFIVLSNYHKSLLPKTVPEEKILVSSNGINLEDFKDPPLERNPHRLIYGSSYDRGLEHLLNIWPDIRKEVPDAELHIYYGWNVYKEAAAKGMAKKEFIPYMEGLMKQPGITEHGRIGHKELRDEYYKSAILAYPCHFPEIHCITGWKAQASGAIPVTTDYAALAETIRSGVKVHGSPTDSPDVLEAYKKELISLMKDTKRQEQLRKECMAHAESFAWSKVAKDWTQVATKASMYTEFTKDRNGWVQDQCEKEDRILDIGGNDGHTFKDWTGSKVTTLDIDLYDIPNFVRGDAHDLPFPDKSFDTAILAEILEHVDDPVKVLQEANRVARKVIITVPEEHEWLDYLDPMISIEDREKKEKKTREVLAKEANPKCKEFYRDDNFEHIWHKRHYTAETLKQDLLKAGYKNPTIKKLRKNDWVFYTSVYEDIKCEQLTAQECLTSSTSGTLILSKQQ